MKRNLTKLLTAGVLLLSSLSTGAYASDEEVLKELRALKARVAELEAQVAQNQRLAINNAHQGHEHAHHDDWVIKTGHDHAHVDIHDIQIHGGLDYRYVDVENANRKSFLHEGEIGISAHLADWIDAAITFTKHHGEEVEIEQAYAKLKFEEINSQLKAGKFFVNFGPENRVGFFDRRTIAPSAMRDGIFGHESWSDEGAEFTYRLPVDFYSTVSVSALNGNNAISFGDGTNEVDNNNAVVALNTTNEFDLDWGTLRLGSSYAKAKWDVADKYDVNVFGADAGFSIGNFDVQAEYLMSDKEQAPGTDDQQDQGYYVWGAYTHPLDMKYLKDIEFLFGYSEFDPETGTKQQEYTPQIGLRLTDTTRIRLMYQIREEKPTDTDNDRFIAQLMYHF